MQIPNEDLFQSQRFVSEHCIYNDLQSCWKVSNIQTQIPNSIKYSSTEVKSSSAVSKT
jgi:hypothetical protein